MIQLKNSFIVRDGVIFNYRGIFDESLVTPKVKWQYDAKFLLKQLVVGEWKVYMTSPVIIIYDAWAGNIFHWLYDCLPRIIRVSKDQAIRSKLLLPISFKNKEYVQQTLPLFYQGGVEYIPDIPFIYSSKILFAEKVQASGSYNLDDLGMIRNNLNLIKGVKSLGPKIYISRQKSVYRRIINYSEVEDLLLKKGFVTVYLEDYDYRDQLSIVSNAHCVVAPHGAGLAHIIMMQKGSILIEIIPDSQPSNNCYQELASVLKINHNYLIGRGVDGKDFQKDDIEVPLHLLEERINLI